MTLEQWAAVSTIAQAFFVVISLVFIWKQLRDSAKLAKAENVRALTEQAATFNAILYQETELAELWYGHGKDLKYKTDTIRYREMLAQWLIFHENIYYQHEEKLLPEEVYASWEVDLSDTMQVHNTDLVDINKYFPGKYGAHLKQIKERVEAYKEKSSKTPSQPTR